MGPVLVTTNVFASTSAVPLYHSLAVLVHGIWYIAKKMAEVKRKRTNVWIMLKITFSGHSLSPNGTWMFAPGFTWQFQSLIQPRCQCSIVLWQCRSHIALALNVPIDAKVAVLIRPNYSWRICLIGGFVQGRYWKQTLQWNTWLVQLIKQTVQDFWTRHATCKLYISVISIYSGESTES